MADVPAAVWAEFEADLDKQMASWASALRARLKAVGPPGVHKGAPDQPRDVDGTWMAAGHFGSHPADEYEATDFAHPADRDYVRRVHDKYKGAHPDRIRKAARRAGDLSLGAKRSGKHELARRYKAASSLLYEMAGKA